MKFWFPLALVLAICLSTVEAQSPPSSSPSPVPSASPTPFALPIPSAAPTRAPENVVRTPPIPVPPPQPAAKLPAPPIPPRAQLTFPRTALERQRVTPAIEVWRAGAHTPQLPARRGNYITPAYVADNQPVMVRVQFDPLARGKTVVVRPGRGAILEPPTEVLQIRPTGECVVTVRLEENAPRGHVTFHCDGLMTTLLLSRRSLASVQANENAKAEGAR